MEDTVANRADPLEYYLDEEAKVHQEEALPAPPWPNGSPASKDAACADVDAVKTLLLEADLLMESAADHGWSIHRCFNGKVPFLAVFTALRTIMECCATGLWLVNDGMDSSERIHRSILRRLENLRQQRALAKLQGDDPCVQRANKRTAQIMIRAEKVGLKIEKPSTPKISDLVESELGLGDRYRTYSGAVHGHYTFIAKLAMDFDPTHPETLEKSIDPQLVDLIIVRAISLLYRLGSALRTYRGLSPDAFDAVLIATKEWLRKDNYFSLDLMNGLPKVAH